MLFVHGIQRDELAIQSMQRAGMHCAKILYFGTLVADIKLGMKKWQF